MTDGRPVRLLTTRTSVVVAFALTAIVLRLAILRALHPKTVSRSLFPFEEAIPSWAAISLNIALYAYLCWIAYLLVSSTERRERVFTTGWAVHLLLFPL